jgi:predicted Holliday junction resolvase-like endonuclease
MTALTVIIFILELVLVAWAAGITALYFQLVKTLRKLSAADQEAFTAIFENESDILHTVSAALKTVEAVENEATAYKEAIDEELEKSRKTSDFALKTIQEARRIYNTINAKPEQEEQNNG